MCLIHLSTHRKINSPTHLDDADLVSDVNRIVIGREPHVSLLLAVRTDQSVHLVSLDIIQSLNGSLDLRLVGANVNDEDQSVLILDLLHGRLGAGVGVLDHRELIQLVQRSSGATRIARLSVKTQSLWAVEVH